jgi:hypothetical protein
MAEILKKTFVVFLVDLRNLKDISKSTDLYLYWAMNRITNRFTRDTTDQQKRRRFRAEIGEIFSLVLFMNLRQENILLRFPDLLLSSK